MHKLKFQVSKESVNLFEAGFQAELQMLLKLRAYEEGKFMIVCFPCSIGYPMVTLGFGFKSFLSFKARQRKQKDVQKENEFYLQLLNQALPPDVQASQMSVYNAQTAAAFQLERQQIREILLSGKSLIRLILFSHSSLERRTVR